MASTERDFEEPGRRRARHHQSRDLRERRDLSARARAGVRPRVALHRPREPDLEARRLCRFVDGRGVSEYSVVIAPDGSGSSSTRAGIAGIAICATTRATRSSLQCPYHGWSYGTDGALVGVPFAKDAYGEQLDRSQWGLVEVARIENYKGTIWATSRDPAAPPFAGRVQQRLQALSGSAAGLVGRP